MGLTDLLQGMNIPQDELMEIMALAKQDPMAAMAKIQKYLSPEMIQSMMQMMMSNPAAMQDAMKQAGISDEDAEKLKDQFGN
jgi:hypothetical protein